MGDSSSPTVKSVASSLASWTVARPLLVLTAILLLILLASGATGYIVHQNAEKEKIQALKDQAKEKAAEMEKLEKEYLAVVTPIIEEREALKKRLADIKNPKKPPKDDKEILARFKSLGY